MFCHFAVLSLVACSVFVDPVSGWVTHGSQSASFTSASLRAGRTWNPDEIPEDFDEAAAQTEKHADKTFDKVEDAPEEMPRDFARDMELLRHTFIPDFEPNVPVIVGTTVVVMLACLWYAFYFFFIYQHDRDFLSKEEEEKLDKDAEEQAATLLGGHFDGARFTKDCSPDMVIVFHIPDCDKYDSDKHTDIAASKVGQIFRSETSNLEWSKFEEVVKQDETPDQLNLELVRSALIKDVFAAVRQMGFTTEVFTSIDKDEIFLCLSLSDEIFIKNIIITSHMNLQMQRSMPDRLGIGDCTDDSALVPPFVRYDPWVVSLLHKQGILDEDDPRDMFHSYKTHDPKGCLLSSLERFRLMFKQISSGFDLDAAKDKGLIVTWYPAHNLHRCRRFGLTWGNFGLVTDFTFQQPINTINTYFGTRVSFLFAWNGLYCKALLALIPPALFWESLGKIARFGFGIDPEEANRQVLGMTIIVLVWAKIAVNLWDREQDFFLKLWGLNPDLKDRIIRAEYRGVLQPADYDSNIQELQASKIGLTLRKCVSGLATLSFISFIVFALLLWLSVFDGNMNLVAAICLAVKIKIFEFIWNILCPILTEFENPKYADDYYNSFIVKQFLFGFVNQYWAFFFLAIKQKYTAAGCPAGGCLWAVRKQLTITIAILSACRVLQVFIEAFLVKFALWWEDRALKKRLGTEDIPKRSFVEEQSKYLDFQAQEQVQAMIQLVVPLGYVMMFGGIAPMIIPMCFVVFALSLRAGAFSLLTAAKRPVPREMYGIGRWREVILGLMYIGLFFSGFLMASYGDMLDGTWMITRMSIIGIFCLIICVIWMVIDCIIPASAVSVEILAARRARIAHRLEEEVTKSNAASLEKEIANLPFTASDRALTNGEWSNIRGAADIEEEDLCTDSVENIKSLERAHRNA